MFPVADAAVAARNQGSSTTSQLFAMAESAYELRAPLETPLVPERIQSPASLRGGSWVPLYFAGFLQGTSEIIEGGAVMVRDYSLVMIHLCPVTRLF